MIKAILLLGPPAIGKSPLGKLLEKAGFRGRRCFHFDFGANLRRIAASFEGVAAGDRKNDEFSLRERAVILDSLASGALLEDENFLIAEKILDRFVKEKGVGPHDVVVMNGLPRHAGQARDLKRIVDMRAVIYLTGPAAVIADRIRLNTGGDRSGRDDDSAGAVEKRLAVFEERTLPLLEYYARHDVPVVSISVGTYTKAEEMLAEFERRLK